MGGQYVLQAPRIDLAQQICRLFVLQMTKTPADALLERRRVARRSEQRLVVVAFDDQAVTSVQQIDDVWRDRAAYRSARRDGAPRR
jgi:hypothetical protein